MKLRVAALVLAASATLACAGGDDGSGGEGDHCACIGGDAMMIEPRCDVGATIDAFATCTGTDMPQPGMTTCEAPFGWVYSTAQIDEALTALRDRAPATITITRSLDGNYSGSYAYAYSPGDGTVFFQSGGYADGFFLGLPVDHLELREASYFDGCLAEVDLAARVDCLFEIGDATLGVCEPP